MNGKKNFVRFYDKKKFFFFCFWEDLSLLFHYWLDHHFTINIWLDHHFSINIWLQHHLINIWLPVKARTSPSLTVHVASLKSHMQISSSFDWTRSIIIIKHSCFLLNKSPCDYKAVLFLSLIFLYKIFPYWAYTILCSY